MVRRPALVGHELPADPVSDRPRAGNRRNEHHGLREGSDELIHRVTQAARELDPAGLQARFDLATADVGIAASIESVVIPTARKLGRNMVAGRRDPVRQLMVTEAIRAWLNLQASLAPAPRRAGTILLACGPRDLDTVFLEALALLLRLHSWPCRVLGARTPILTVTAAAQATDTAAVVVSATPRGRRQAISCLTAAAGLGVPTFCTGSAFRTHRSGSAVQGRYLGPGIQDACTALVDALSPNEIPGGDQRPSCT